MFISVIVFIATAAPGPNSRQAINSATFAHVVLVGTTRAWRCSGVLIGPTEVITARHCLPSTRIAIGRGIDDLITIIDVQNAIPDSRRDIAVLHLKSPAPVSLFPSVRSSLGAAAPPLGVVRIVGFGAIDPFGRYGFGFVHFRDVRIDGWGCDDDAAQNRTGCMPGDEFVLLGTGAGDSCDGDSGGPVFERQPTSPTGWQLVGITSRAINSSKHACGDGGIYTRVTR